MADQHRVAATSLNLRSEPLVRPGNRIAVLPEGQLVTKLGESGTEGWWQMRTTLTGTPVEGFVAARHLVPAGAPPAAPAARAIEAVHLTQNRPDVRRDRDSGRAFPIGEPGRPPAPTGSDAQRQDALLAIIDWLDVESGARWRPGAGLTFCNVYANDVCYLAGVYLPRVWWTGRALTELARGRPATPALGSTIHELNANALCDWLEEFGPQFGW